MFHFLFDGLVALSILSFMASSYSISLSLVEQLQGTEEIAIWSRFAWLGLSHSLNLQHCMVRVIPLFESPAPVRGSPHFEGGFSALEKVQSPELEGLFNHMTPRGSVVCRHTHQTHPFGVFYGENPLDYSFTLVLLEISLVIIITRILRFLLKPLKQPRIVSEVLGGIIIGPSVLGRSTKFKKNVFPENAAYVVKNVGTLGFTYFLFISGVKMDLGIIKKAGKKQIYTALIGVIVPLVLVIVIAIIYRKSMDKDEARISSIGAISSGLAITAFPVLYPILQELNLLSSEVGRQALSTAMIGDVIGINAVVAFEAASQGEEKKMAALWYCVSVVVTFLMIVGGLKRVMDWIIQKTPEGQPVDQIYVIGILLGVAVMGFITDMFGVAIGNGALWIGLAIPDGPPLGSTLVERSETIVLEILMPFSFAYVGLYTDVKTMSWPTLEPLFLMTVVGYLSKLIATLCSALYFQMPIKDGLALSLILNLRGQVELFLFLHWMDKRIVTLPGFSLMVILTTLATAIATPIISILYDPTRPYIINKRRTIQHTPPNTEIHMVACIHDQENVAGIINLLEVSNPTLSSPFILNTVHLIELVGRASPVFIDHEKQDVTNPFEDSSSSIIHNALNQYKESREGLVKIHSFTAVSPRRSMYQDVCEVALASKATFIILPFHKNCLDVHIGTEVVRQGVQSVNLNVLSHAPCSVGILVDRSPLQSQIMTRSFRRRKTHQFAVLFLGGADAREALAYADRMIGNLDVCLTVIRFLSYNYEGDNEMEKKLDDGIVTWFWVKNESNERVIYREVVVKNGEETVSAIGAMNTIAYDLWIMGRQQGINPVLLDGLSIWSENHELGVIGDYVASMDLGGLASVLVIHQQVLRQGMTTTTSRLDERFVTCNIC